MEDTRSHRFNTNMWTRTLLPNTIWAFNLKTFILDPQWKTNTCWAIWTSKCSMLHKEDHLSWIQTSCLQMFRLPKEQRQSCLLNILWLWQIKVSIQANLQTERDKALELATGRINPCMKANGLMGLDKEMESSWDLVKAHTKDSGFTTKRMARASNILRMATLSMGSGSMTN